MGSGQLDVLGRKQAGGREEQTGKKQIFHSGDLGCLFKENQDLLGRVGKTGKHAPVILSGKSKGIQWLFAVASHEMTDCRLSASIIHVVGNDHRVRQTHRIIGTIG
jgi:hypothetical protein